MHSPYRWMLPARCLGTPNRRSLHFRSRPEPSMVACSGSAGIPPRLARTILFVAVKSSSTWSSSNENHLGMAKILNGMSNMMSTGNPIAAMVCEMATHTATVENWMAM